MRLGKHQSGFGTVEILLVVLVVAVLAAVGFMVYQRHKSTIAKGIITAQSHPASQSQSKPAQITKPYTDSSKTYTLQYPTAWATNLQRPGDGMGGIGTLLDSHIVTFIPENAPKITTDATAGASGLNAVVVTAFKSSDTRAILDAYISSGSQTAPQNLTINSYPALYQQVVSAPDYTDDIYAVTHLGVTLVFSFREKQGSTVNTENIGFDATSTVPAYTALVKSVTFLN